MTEDTPPLMPGSIIAPEPELGDLAAALAAFQAEMPTVAKTQRADVKTNTGSYSYTYAGLADVSEAAMPLLTKHGLSFTALPTRTTNGPMLVGMLLHTSGQRLTAELPIQGSSAQQIGSSLTYGRRYLFGCMTGLVTDDDDDGQLAQQASKRPPRNRIPKAEKAPVKHTDQQTSQADQQAAEPPTPQPTRQLSDKQRGMLISLMDKAGLRERDEVLAYVADTIGHQVESRNDLTSREASKIIDRLKGDLEEPGQ